MTHVRSLTAIGFGVLGLGLVGMGVYNRQLARRLQEGQVACANPEPPRGALEHRAALPEPTPADPRLPRPAAPPQARVPVFIPPDSAADHLRECLLERDNLWSSGDLVMNQLVSSAVLANGEDKPRLKNLVRKLTVGRREIMGHLAMGRKDARTASRELDSLTREFLSEASEILKPTATDD